MRRIITAVALGLGALGGLGCQNFKYVQKNPDGSGGVVEFNAKDKDAVLAKLQQQEGEIEVVAMTPKGKPAGLFNPNDPNAPVQPSDRLTATSGFGSFAGGRDEDKLQLTFHKKTPAGTTPPGLPPAPKDDPVMQAGHQTVYPSKTAGAASVQPAGGANSKLPAVNMTGISGVCTDGCK